MTEPVAVDTLQVLKEQVFGNGHTSTQSPQPNTEQPTNTEIQQPTAEQQAAAAASTPTEQIIDVDKWVKDTFGYDNAETAKAEFEKLKNAPSVKAEPTFPDDTHKRFYDYFTQGKEDELYQSLHSRQQIKALDSMTDEQKIKLHIKMQNPLFDNELIDYQFSKDYGFDEADYKDEEGNVTDQMGLKYAKIAAQQKMQNDITRANEYFAQHKSKIELQPIQQPVQEDAGFKEYQALMASESDKVKQLSERLAKLTEAEVAYNYKFNDEASKLAFDINFGADKEGFDVARSAALDYFSYLGKQYANAEGVPQNEKFVRDIYIAQNLDKFAAEIAKQAINADRKWFLANQKNIGDGSQRNYVQEPVTDIQKLKQQVFG